MTKTIKTKQDYVIALKRFESLFQAEEGTPDGDEAELLALVIEKYESDTFKIDATDPVEAIKFHVDQLGLKQADIAELFGGKTRVSEVLNKKSPLTIKTIYLLNRYLNIPLNSLINEKSNYELKDGRKAISEKIDQINWKANYPQRRRAS
jgi:HTH-type transcriptional regulator/antitoxin HigA